MGYNREKPSNRVPAENHPHAEAAAARSTGVPLVPGLCPGAKEGSLWMSRGPAVIAGLAFDLGGKGIWRVGHTWVWILALPCVSNWTSFLVILNSLPFS